MEHTSTAFVPAISKPITTTTKRSQPPQSQLSDVEGMMSIFVEDTEARDSLGDDKELTNTYEWLTTLDGKRRFALAAASSHKEEAGRLRKSTTTTTSSRNLTHQKVKV